MAPTKANQVAPEPAPEPGAEPGAEENGNDGEEAPPVVRDSKGLEGAYALSTDAATTAGTIEYKLAQCQIITEHERYLILHCQVKCDRFQELGIGEDGSLRLRYCYLHRDRERKTLYVNRQKNETSLTVNVVRREEGGVRLDLVMEPLIPSQDKRGFFHMPMLRTTENQGMEKWDRRSSSASERKKKKKSVGPSPKAGAKAGAKAGGSKETEGKREGPEKKVKKRSWSIFGKKDKGEKNGAKERRGSGRRWSLFDKDGKPNKKDRWWRRAFRRKKRVKKQWVRMASEAGSQQRSVKRWHNRMFSRKKRKQEELLHRQWEEEEVNKQKEEARQVEEALEQTGNQLDFWDFLD